eukprot:scaffold34615_cov180-Amphora_coffeaeformis.AAC.14
MVVSSAVNSPRVLMDNKHGQMIPKRKHPCILKVQKYDRVTFKYRRLDASFTMRSACTVPHGRIPLGKKTTKTRVSTFRPTEEEAYASTAAINLQSNRQIHQSLHLSGQNDGRSFVSFILDRMKSFNNHCCGTLGRILRDTCLVDS